MKPEGIFSNGDLWYGHKWEEDGKYYFQANYPTSDPLQGGDYETDEVPDTFPLFAMTIFPDGTRESEVNEYFLAKKIGDARYGSQCPHSRSKHGYCPDCLRRII